MFGQTIQPKFDFNKPVRLIDAEGNELRVALRRSELTMKHDEFQTIELEGILYAPESLPATAQAPAPLPPDNGEMVFLPYAEFLAYHIGSTLAQAEHMLRVVSPYAIAEAQRGRSSNRMMVVPRG